MHLCALNEETCFTKKQNAVVKTTLSNLSSNAECLPAQHAESHVNTYLVTYYGALVHPVYYNMIL